MSRRDRFGMIAISSTTTRLKNAKSVLTADNTLELALPEENFYEIDTGASGR
jgi:hypothetical protein